MYWACYRRKRACALNELQHLANAVPAELREHARDWILRVWNQGEVEHKFGQGNAD